VTSKKQGARALAHKPNHAVPGDEAVWMALIFINVT
jgi:hypothetical protein